LSEYWVRGKKAISRSEEKRYRIPRLE
jgi:hypothetical protein